jgi:hypothetical protein
MLTLAKFKAFLEIDAANTSKDDVLQSFIDDAIGEANRATDRKLQYQSHQVYLDGYGDNTLNLPQRPIVSVTSIKYYDGNEYTDLGATVIITGGYQIMLTDKIFPCGKKNILIEFNAGYLWADEWIISHAYVIGDKVIYNNNLYICNTNNNDAVFTIAKWDLAPAEIVPADLEKAIKYMAAAEWYESPAGKEWFMKASENVGSQVNTSWVKKDIDVSAVLNSYRNKN